jgi:hypothetical protein
VAAALILVGLFAWRRFPVASGLAIGSSLAWKPLGVLAAPLLAAHRPAAAGSRRHLVAGAAGLATAGLALLIGGRYLGEFASFGVALAPEDFRVSRTVSLQRLLGSLGLDLDRVTVSAAVALAALALARARAWNRDELLSFVIAAACLSTPALWPHSLLMTLPIQVLALRRAHERDPAAPRRRSGSARRARVYELALVWVGVLALHFSDGVGGVDPAPSLALAAALAPPVLAAPLLAWYVVRDPRRHDRHYPP